VTEVTILGLYPDPLDLRGSVWTLNDFYRRYPEIQPDRIYHLHWGFDKDDRPGRFPGDWKAKYREYQEQGSELVTLDKIDGLESYYLNTQTLEEQFPQSALTCSIAIMICEAVREGFETIHLRGVKLLAGEFFYQVRGIREAIALARSRGIQVTVTAGREKEWQDTLERVDWADITDIEMPYWCWQKVVKSANLKPDLEKVNITET
jgi:hypothetical protein